MHLNYGISLFNFFRHNYPNYEGGLPELEDALSSIAELGYVGVELWRFWREWDLFEPTTAEAVSEWCHELRRSFHTQGAKTPDDHKKQIDAVRGCGVELLVVHPGDLCDYRPGDDGRKYRPDIAKTREVVNYGADRNVTLALENGGLAFLVEAIENVDNLRICLDIGHVYIEPDRQNPGQQENKSMADYLDALGPRLAHLHIQDILPESEKLLPDAGLDHYTPGTGSIPESDWKLLFSRLEELEFDGLAMLEIRPRNPFLQASRALSFLEEMTIDRRTVR